MTEDDIKIILELVREYAKAKSRRPHDPEESTTIFRTIYDKLWKIRNR